MSRLIIAVALLSAMAVSALAEEQQAQTQEETRDGRWLRAGIREYQRFTEKAEHQTLAEATRGVAAVAYVRGVLDATWSAVGKALVQESIVNASKNSKDPKSKISADMLTAMHASDGYFAPLWKTDFFNSGFQIDQYVQMISNYLDAHPEKWDKHAQDLIGDAMVDAFPAKKE